MINLLPPAEKAILKQEETTALTAIIGIVIVACLVALSLMVFLIASYLQNQVGYQKIVFDEASKEFQNSELQGLHEKIGGTNKVFGDLKSFYQQKTFLLTDIIERVYNVMPQEMRLTSLSFSRSGLSQEKSVLSTGQLFITGFAPKREMLFELRENLEAQPYFKEINFPPANWVKPEDVNFSATLKIDLAQ